MKLFRLLFIITIICFTLFINNTTIYSQKETKKQKLYIATIKNTGQAQSISKRVHSIIKLSIFENFGQQFHILDDEAISVMYKQAEKIIASGNDDMSSLSQIADGINADIIIYGETSKDNNGIINLNLNALERKNKNLGIKSIVKLTCHKSQVDFYSLEAGKKLITPNYKIIMDNETNFSHYTKVDGLDISIMNFTYSDDVINQMLIYLKELISKGDDYYYKNKLDKALKVYKDTLDKIEKKLLDEQKLKLSNFTTELKKRIDSVYISKIQGHEGIGDKYYSDFNFLNSTKKYEECLLLSNKIFDNKIKTQINKKFNKKIETITTTAKNYAINIVKNHIDQALYLNLKDDLKNAKRILIKTQAFIEKNGYTTGEIISMYNTTANLLKIKKLKLSKIKNLNFKIGDIGPAGGIIFYDKGESSDGWRYMEVAPEDQGLAIWGCVNKFAFELDNLGYSKSGYHIGTGKLNTQTIINSCKEAEIASKIAASYQGGGQNDWFLPSAKELDLIYTNLHEKKLSNFTDDYYWSSTEHSARTAYLKLFSKGYEVLLSKDFGPKRVRAIRAFDI